MDCKPESAARTFCRITLISLQGFVAGVIGFILAVMFIPFAPLVLTVSRWIYQKNIEANKGIKGTCKRLAMLPLWIIQSFCIGCVMPFDIIRRRMVEIKDIAMIEWTNRWKAAHPKTPDGHPLSIEEPHE